MRRQSLTDPRPGLTKRQTEVLERLEQGAAVKRIATDIGVTPAAVYQTIERLRRSGHLPQTFTPSGARPRAGAPSRLAELRDWDADEEHAESIEAAVATADVAALAYCLGRIDAAGEEGVRKRIVEAALRRLAVLGDERG